MKKSILILALGLVSVSLAGCDSKAPEVKEEINFASANLSEEMFKTSKNSDVDICEKDLDILTTNVVSNKDYIPDGLVTLESIDGLVGVYNILDQQFVIPQIITNKSIELNQIAINFIEQSAFANGQKIVLIKVDDNVNSKSYIVDPIGTEYYKGTYIENEKVIFKGRAVLDDDICEELTDSIFQFGVDGIVELKEYYYENGIRKENSKVSNLLKPGDKVGVNEIIDLTPNGYTGYSYMFGSEGEVFTFKDNVYEKTINTKINAYGSSTIVYGKTILSQTLTPTNDEDYDVDLGGDYVKLFTYKADLLSGEGEFIDLPYLIVNTQAIKDDKGLYNHALLVTVEITDNKFPMVPPKGIIVDEDVNIVDKNANVMLSGSKKLADDRYYCDEFIFDDKGNIVFAMDAEPIICFPKQRRIIINTRYGQGLIDYDGKVIIKPLHISIIGDDETGNFIAANKQYENSSLYFYDQDGNLKERRELLPNSELTTNVEMGLMSYKGEDNSYYVVDAHSGTHYIKGGYHVNDTKISTHIQGEAYLNEMLDSNGNQICKLVSINGEKKFTKTYDLVLPLTDNDGLSLKTPIKVDDISNINFDTLDKTYIQFKVSKSGLYSFKELTSAENVNLIYNGHFVTNYYVDDGKKVTYLEAGIPYIVGFFPNLGFKGQIKYVGEPKLLQETKEVISSDDNVANGKVHIRKFVPTEDSLYICFDTGLTDAFYLNGNLVRRARSTDKSAEGYLSFYGEKDKTYLLTYKDSKAEASDFTIKPVVKMVEENAYSFINNDYWQFNDSGEVRTIKGKLEQTFQIYAKRSIEITFDLVYKHANGSSLHILDSYGNVKYETPYESIITTISVKIQKDKYIEVTLERNLEDDLSFAKISNFKFTKY